MSNLQTCDKNQQACVPSTTVTTKQKAFDYLGLGLGGLGLLAMTTTQAYAIDFEPLKTAFTELQTAVTAVIAIALTVTISIVGWRWVKRVAFGI